MNWFYLSERQEVGPLSVAALEEIHANGCIADETPVRREDSAEWQAYATVFSSQRETHQNPDPLCDRPSYKFHCIHCQQRIAAEEDCSGKTVQCPTCGADFVVPQPPREMEPINPHRGVLDKGQSPDIPSSQKKFIAYPAQAPGTSNSFGKRETAGPVVIKKGKGKSRFLTTVIAAVIVTVVAVGALLITKAKSNNATTKRDAPQIELSDDIDQTDKTSGDEVDHAPDADRNNNDSRPSLDLARYARESKQKESKSQEYQPKPSTTTQRSPRVANGITVSGLYIDMDEDLMLKRLQEIFGPALKLTREQSIKDKNRELIRFEEPSLLESTEYKTIEERDCMMIVDKVTSRVHGMTISGKHFEKMFKVKNIDVKEFSQQVMSRYGIKRLDYDASHDGLAVYTTTVDGVKISIVKYQSGMLGLSLDFVEKASF